ncbi:hypothetical protein BASA81_002041 [Batrachochytrium salamandrivorans]|nr:hypothetical protein BASA81_002041 [Batrachochytrium salamandrivorans]
MLEMDDLEAVELFKKVLRFRTVSGEGPTNGQYHACSQFLAGELVKIGFQVDVIEFVPNKPVVIATLAGTKPHLPSIVLNGHYDVVPAVSTKWNQPDPFDPMEDDEGRIFARGTQDMKCVVAQYLVALHRLVKRNRQQFRRTLHVTLVPDEEIGGMDGMNEMIKSGIVKSRMEPIGLALDEGLANPNNEFTVFYGERLPLWCFITVPGPTGHGSRFIENTAVENLLKISTKAMEFRQEQFNEFTGKGCSHCQAKKLGDVTTLNITYLQSGVPMREGQQEFEDGEEKVALNCIPTQAKLGLDIRVPPHVKKETIENMLTGWVSDFPGASWRYAPWTDANGSHATTSIDPKLNPFWEVFHRTLETEFNTKVCPEVFPAGTDSRFLRQHGVPALGFSPIRNTPILLHEHNEYLSKDTFLEGCLVYEKLLTALLQQLPREEE